MKQILQLPVVLIRFILKSIQQIFSFIARQIRAFFDSFKKALGSFTNTINGISFLLLFSTLFVIALLILNAVGLVAFNANFLFVGAIIFFASLLMNFAAPLVLSTFYAEQKWTVGKQVIQSVIIALISAFLCIFWADKIDLNTDTATTLASFLGVGFIIGLILSLIYERIQSQKYRTNAREIELKIPNLKFENNNTLLMPMMLLGEGSNKLNILPNQLILAEMSTTVSEIYYQNMNGLDSKTINANVVAVENELYSHPQFLRITPNEIINLRAIQSVKGTARGYQIKLAKVDKNIIVSRKYTSQFENKFI